MVGHLIWDEDVGSSNLSSSTGRPQVQLPAAGAPNEKAEVPGQAEAPAGDPPNARGPIGEGSCLRSSRLQVRVLPGVLCPRRKWAMRRDVTPEEAGSSPAGHPDQPDPRPDNPAGRASAGHKPSRESPGGTSRRAGKVPDGTICGSGPTGRGVRFRTGRFGVRIPGAAPMDRPRRGVVWHTGERRKGHERCDRAQRFI